MERPSDRPRPTPANEGSGRTGEGSGPPSSRRSSPPDPPPSRPRLAPAIVATACAVTAVGCAHAPRKTVAVPAARDEEDGVGRPRPLLPPFELIKDNGPDNDGVVRVVGEVSCSGVLVADDLVLTAHHCVSARDAAGKPLSFDVDPASVTIELGGDYLPWGEVRVRAIVSPDCGYASGRGDLALVVLSRKLIGVPFATPRLDSGPSLGEAVAPVGFGRCATSPNAIERVVRAGGSVDFVNDALFVAPASICPGDSGGPVYAKGGDVVGVVSASVMDGDDRTIDPSVFTRVDRWRRLFSAAREIAAGASPSELPPFRACEP